MGSPRDSRRRVSGPLALLLALGGGCAGPGSGPSPQAPAGRQEGLPSIEDATEACTILSGFLPAYWDPTSGKLYLEVPPADDELLYLVSLPAGLGSNRVGLDRAQLGTNHVVRFLRAGPRVLLHAPNLDWTSSAEDPLERAVVRDAFASSVLWGFEVVAKSGERVLVDATDFLLRDAHGVARSLRQAGQGDFRLDASRSTVWMEATRGYPDNTELEVLLTFTGDQPGPEVRATAADPRAVSLRLRHSFVRLPERPADQAFRPRRADPRCGFFETAYRDVAAPVDAPLLQRFVQRHHLRPGGQPIVYYVDSAAPEPVRTALLEGARYWEPVFAAAGFPGGYRVELLPEGVDPQDVRYNVVTWVPRSTRGWSYGTTVSDPRSGEILKGHVTLGALRVRQDVLLAEGLLSPYAEGEARDARVLDMALARIRQLSAHEIGHTLGLRHNFAASTADRASVMDYPAPLVGIDEAGDLDLSDAYAPGCGAWDELAIRYGYGHAEPEDEAAFLAACLADMEASGVPFLTDADARGSDRAHPLANLWDNGDDPVAMLEHEIEVRRIALEGFGEAALNPGEALSRLEEVLVPLYFHHRYQLEAAVRQLGGVWYRHAVRGQAPAGVRPVEAEVQHAALAAVLRTLEPEFCALPPGLLASLPPPAPGSDGTAERFDDRDLLPDPAGIAAANVRLTLDLLLDPTRAARLEDQSARDPRQPGFDDVLGALVDQAWGDGDRTVQRSQLLRRLMDLAVDERVPVRVARVALTTLEDLRLTRLTVPEDAEGQRQQRWERMVLDAFFADPRQHRPAPPPAPIPPGSPIGVRHVDCGFAAPWMP